MNPNTIPYVHYQDVQISELDIRKEFDDNMAKGKFVEALELLNKNKSKLQGRAYVAESIGNLVNGVLDLEHRYTDNVPMFLSDLATQIFAIINQYRMIGQWDKETSYEAYNFVTNEDKTYMALKKVTPGILTTNTEYWLELHLKGEQGSPGIDVVVRNDWNPNTQYIKNVLVVHNNNLYVSKLPNKGIEPGTDEAFNYWMEFITISKGEIIIGDKEPQSVPENTIWFKTPADPLSSRVGMLGVMQRKTSSGWEEIYPLTAKSLVSRINEYYPVAYNQSIVITPRQWVFKGNHLEYTYVNDLITEDAQVMVYRDSDSELSTKIYNVLTMEKLPGKLVFSLGLSYYDGYPNANVAIKIKIRKRG